MTLINARTLALILLSTLAACASKKDAGPKRVEQEPTEWDYTKIRETRQAEKTQLPDLPDHSEDEANCIIMTAAQMKRAKASGCRKMDPREGGGEGAYCCPRE